MASPAFTTTVSGSSPTQSITIQSGDYASGAGDKFIWYQDALGTTSGSKHCGEAGLSEWYHGNYSTTVNLTIGQDTTNSESSLFDFDGERSISCSGTGSAFAVANSSNTACQVVHLLGPTGTSQIETYHVLWANGRHAQNKKASKALSSQFPGVNMVHGGNANTAAFSAGSATKPQGYFSGPKVALCFAQYATSDLNNYDGNGFSSTSSDGTVYDEYYSNNAGGISISGGHVFSTLFVMDGYSAGASNAYDNALTTTIRDQMANDYRTHGTLASSPTTNGLKLVTGTAVTSWTDVYGTSVTSRTSSYDEQYAAWRIQAASNVVKVGSSTATDWGVDGTTVVKRYGPNFIISSWTDSAATPTVKLGASTLVSGTDFVAYNDTGASVLYLSLLKDLAGTEGELDITAGSGTVNTLTLSDSLSLADTIGNAAGRTATDTIVLGESVIGGGGTSGTDTATTGDTLSSTLLRALTDAMQSPGTDSQYMIPFGFWPGIVASIGGLQDKGTVSGNPALTDPLTGADSLSQALGYALSDAPMLAETVLTALGISLSDALTLSDAGTLSAVQVLSLVLADSLSAGDTLTQALAGSFADAPNAADALALAILSSLSDAGTLGEAGAMGAVTTLADTLTHADALGSGSGATLSDSLGPGESLSTALATALADALSIADVGSLSAGQILSLVLADALTASDSLSTSLQQALSDALTASDSPISAILIGLSDALTLADVASLSAGGVASLIVADALGLSDVAGLVAGAALADSASPSDSLSGGAGMSLSDAHALADTLSTVALFALSEALAPADSMAQLLGTTLADQLGPSDALAMVLAGTLAEALGLSDSVTATVAAAISDALSLLDTAVLSSGAVSILNLADALSASDSVATALGTALTDGLSLSDALTAAIAAALSDLLTLADAGTLTTGGGAIARSIGRMIVLATMLQGRVTATMAQPAIVTQAPQIVVLAPDGSAMQSSISVRAGRTPPPTVLTLQDAANGFTPIDLTGATVTARMYSVPQFGAPHTGTPVFSGRACTINSPSTAGNVTITWQSSDFAAAGSYELDCDISSGGTDLGSVQSLQITCLAES